ncbi:MAG: MFS transporter [Paludibacteraceae bacterium]|nr:MFS transporter [Paludibacteraceae bacterium]
MKERLWTKDFTAACCANFLYFLGFYSLMPILALYLRDTFFSNRSTIGVVLACYTVSALLIRPFSGYLIDTISRKTLYLIALGLFVSVFAGYPIAASVWLFALLRAIHGLAFGTLTVSANTLVIDITPSSRRGAALGFYGIANNLAMAIGPMVSVYLHDYYGYNAVFYNSFFTCLIAFCIGCTIKVPKKNNSISQPTKEEQKIERHLPFSLDRFILIKGLPAGLNLFLLGIPYGMITTFIALYSEELNLGKNTGPFFFCMAIGIIFSRLFSGKEVDKGNLTIVIHKGSQLCIIAILLLATAYLATLYSSVITTILFNGSALLVGLGYGSLFPAFNTLFVSLAPHYRRGTANATYMTTWDIGVGFGMLLGGIIGHISNYSVVFLVGSLANIISYIFYERYSKEHFLRNKLE